MSQVIHTVTQTEKEYHDYLKKEAHKRAINALLALMVFVAGMSSICYLAGFFNG